MGAHSDVQPRGGHHMETETHSNVTSAPPHAVYASTRPSCVLSTSIHTGGRFPLLCTPE